MTTTIKRTTSPFRYDIVGSYLRPEALKEARKQFQNNEITVEELTKVEDQAIIELIKQQEAAGLKAVTDGEFRRSWWHLDFFWGFNGIEKVEELGYQFANQNTRAETARLNGGITGDNHPFVAHYNFTRQHTSPEVEVRQTFPAPAQLIIELLRPENLAATQAVYPTQDELIQAIAKAYQQVIKDLYEAGARTIQLDDCTWGAIVTPEGVTLNEEQKATKEAQKALFLKVNNAALVGLPDDLKVNTHICRGNYISSWASSGAYDEVASPLFNQQTVDAYYLEYDTERSGGFEPLAHVSDDKYVVLGLLTSKDGELEDRQAVIQRIHEAAQYVPLERLCLSTQCGFASTEEGNILSEDEQWEKIALVKSIAEEVWGKEA